MGGCVSLFGKSETIVTLDEGNVITGGGNEPVVSAAKHGNFDIAVKLSSKQRIIKLLL